ncbi:MAG: NADP-dependent isocitrate dehydrogenase [Thermoplasmata archaeon]|nr:NADP-dependent isocitrate dehydrogenase [Thermoplasmata archaeon]
MGDIAKEILIPYIPGDGIGPDIMSATVRVLDVAMRAATAGGVKLHWEEVLAGEKAFKKTGCWLPEETLSVIEQRGVAIKGPLTTPVGGGIRSLNVTIRQSLDLYASVRPARHYAGVPSPVKHPEKLNVVIFRENTEDVYKGIEWKRGSEEAKSLIAYLRSEFGVELGSDCGLGLKPISESATKRLVRSAMEYAVRKGRKVVTFVHKGNIMKHTEGAFREWGYELVRDEFSDHVVFESEMPQKDLASIPKGMIMVNDRIADNMLQQILTRPEEYSVLVAPNLNGDYLADACAAQVGGLGFAPGANIGDGVAVFEPVHGTAPKYAGRNIANPCALILSGSMMLEYLGYTNASSLVEKAVEGALAHGVMTRDFAKLAGLQSHVGTSEFADAVIDRMA